MCSNKSFYGLKPETLDSLIIEFLPPFGHVYKDVKEADVDNSQELPIYLHREVLNTLRNDAGFHIPKVMTIYHSIATCMINSLPHFSTL